MQAAANKPELRRFDAMMILLGGLNLRHARVDPASVV
jgi:hypothetical protein